VSFEKVMKFGGAALADGPAVERVCAIVRDFGGERPIVVVSAHQGVTALLDAVAQAAARGEPDGERVRIRHRSLLRQLGLQADLLDRYFAELASLLGESARRRELPLGDRDLVLSYGERMSARIVAHALKRAGVQATPVDAFDLGLTTDSNHGAARPLPESRGPIRAALLQVPGVPVVTGFLAQDRHGNLTTLGRNGSDLTAALVAEAVGARELELWKTVGGMMTADPAIVSDACVVERISFADAAALAAHGAEILHPDALAPVQRGGVAVRLRDVRDPEGAGTVVEWQPGPRAGPGGSTGPVGIAARRRLVCVPLADPAALDPVLCTFVDGRARAYFVPGPSVDAWLARLEPRALLEKDLALAAVVGASSDPAGPSRALDALARADIPVVEAVVGVERSSQLFVLHAADLERAVRELHAVFFARQGARIP
jgi:aspartate kinase